MEAVGPPRQRTPERPSSLMKVWRATRRTLSDSLRSMVGFRDILVHGYGAVDLEIVKDVVENRLGDLLAFVGDIRTRMGGSEMSPSWPRRQNG